MISRFSILLILAFVFCWTGAVAQSGKNPEREWLEAQRSMVNAVYRVANFAIWPNTAYRRNAKNPFLLGVETTNPPDFTLTRLGNQQVPDGRRISVRGLPEDLSAPDLKRFEIIVVQNGDQLETIRTRTENSSTLIVGTFPGALDAGCAIALVETPEGWAYEFNLAELKSRKIEYDSRALEYSNRLLKNRVPLRSQ